MKICFIGNAYDINSQNYIQYFIEQKHEVHFVHWGKLNWNEVIIKNCIIHESGKNAFGFFLHKLTKKIVNSKNEKLNPLLGIIKIIVGITSIKKLIKKIKPDIICVLSVLNGLPCNFIDFHPIVIVPLGLDISIRPEKSKIWNAMIKFVLKKSDLIHVSGEDGKQRLKELNLPTDKIFVCIFGIDTQLFNPSARSQDVREKLGLGDFLSVLCALRIRSDTVKWVKIFVESIPYVIKRYPNAKFILFGGADLTSIKKRDFYVKQIYELAIKINILDKIVFIGYVPHEEMPKYLASTDILVDPYFISYGGGGIGLTNEEAFSCGLAVILTKKSATSFSVQEIIKKIPNKSKPMFLEYKHDSHTELAEKILKLANDKQLSKDMSELSRQIAIEYFDLNKNWIVLEKKLYDMCKN